MKIIIDTETSGIPLRKNGKLCSPLEFENYDNARLLELAYILLDEKNNVIKSFSSLVKTKAKIENEAIHGISKEMCENGMELFPLLQTFLFDFEKCEVVIGHNIEFDMNIIKAEINRLNDERKRKAEALLDFKCEKKKYYCTMKRACELLKLDKWPSLKELSFLLFPASKFEFHRALKDCEITEKCYTILYKSEKYF